MAIGKLLLKIKLHVIKGYDPTPSPSASSLVEIASSTVNATAAPASSLPATRVDDLLRRVFSQFDKDGDGRISTAELEIVARVIGALDGGLVEADAVAVMAALDLNGDGSIDFKEFTACIKPAAAGSQSTAVAAIDIGESSSLEEDAEDLRSAFAVYDRDGDGVITAEELQLVLRKLMGDENNAASLADCRKMIRAVDRNGDGVVSFDEFVAMMTTRAGCPGSTVLIG